MVSTGNGIHLVRKGTRRKGKTYPPLPQQEEGNEISPSWQGLDTSFIGTTKKNHKIFLLHKVWFGGVGWINYEHKLYENVKLEIAKDKFKIEGNPLQSQLSCWHGRDRW